ncbi:NADH:flavin oxidoreductase/NADH oxidase [Suhomyces tanzawaensis NRRL Y-17324]|uniref:Probable NADPH dehydrogenase n=1 Tax=Suhomyces tanzawaensis NRRL Y-17324 TaxID=984487 RepID=A0A1E4SFV4_9ASCO|nr:NADH:flavin oxidoreductase/NADH oxidase [Suhomyces tanzawaensis NRRL Y-17324]ODV78399.1 NADH:flavin oxidoreductase/NADH oxidase [Suhomyces tanzawaensis NRRL Y-17324]
MSQPIEITPLKDTPLFSPIKVGQNELLNRVVYPPTTRKRSLKDCTPSDLNVEYYDARSKTKGSLLIAEATYVGPQTIGILDTPGIFTDRHVKAWKAVTDKVHANGSFIGVQGWALGRIASPSVLKEAGIDLHGPSAIYPDEEYEKAAIAAGNPIKALTEQEIHDYIYKTFSSAAKNAIAAGFDYFEIHGAHGYLVDTFLHPSSNQRTDKYGGSIENRARFVLELVDHLSEVIGADKLAIRLSPWAKHQGIKAELEEVHPITTISYLLHEFQKRADAGKQLAYISIVEPRVSGNKSVAVEDQTGSNTFVGDIWKGVILKSGNYSYDAPTFNTLKKDVADNRTLVGFSRYYTSNPDLVDRLYHGHSLEPYDRPTFYTNNNWRYNTYTNHGEENTHDQEVEEKRTVKEISVTA